MFSRLRSFFGALFRRERFEDALTEEVRFPPREVNRSRIIRPNAVSCPLEPVAARGSPAPGRQGLERRTVDSARAGGAAARCAQRLSNRCPTG